MSVISILSIIYTLVLGIVISQSSNCPYTLMSLISLISASKPLMLVKHINEKHLKRQFNTGKL
jgi:hypothetical protein